MKKALLFFLLTIFWFLLLFPKAIIWDKFESNLRRYHIALNAEKINENYAGLKLENLQVFYEKLDIGVIKKAEIRAWMIYNKIKLTAITLSPNVPISEKLTIKYMNISYTIFKPKHIYIDGISNYGGFKGDISLFKRKGSILLDTKSIKNSFLKEYFKKTKEGMKYEFDF